MRTWIVALSLATSITNVARANEEDLERPPVVVVQQSASQRVWYGWQTLIVDSSLIGVYAAAHALPPVGSAPIEVADFFTFWFAAATVHSIHGGPVGTSIAIHLAAPLAGMLAGFGIGAMLPYTCPGWFCFGINPLEVTGAEIGMGIGAGVAMIADAAFLSRARVAEDVASSRASWMIAPRVSAHGGALTIGRAF